MTTINPATEEHTADLIEEIGYTLTALSRANQNHHPATVVRLCAFLTQRLDTVAALARTVLDTQAAADKETDPCPT